MRTTFRKILLRGCGQGLQGRRAVDCSRLIEDIRFFDELVERHTGSSAGWVVRMSYGLIRKKALQDGSAAS
jgi:hypothetical protein